MHSERQVQLYRFKKMLARSLISDLKSMNSVQSFFRGLHCHGDSSDLFPVGQTKSDTEGIIEEVMQGLGQL